MADMNDAASEPRFEIAFRPFTRGDFPLLGSWLREPEVARWWPKPGLSGELLEADYGPAIDGREPTRLYIVLCDGEPVGFTETYLHADHPHWDHAIGLPDVAGIDYLIGVPARYGQGLGTAVIGSFCRFVFALYPDVPALASVPQAANTASRRVLEKNGFRLVEERMVESDDPGDAGLAAIYTLERPGA